jgi:GDPmannose 4,6-dehydratase
MLQQEQPEDFVIATGIQYSVRDFVNAAAAELGMTLAWQGAGVQETGTVVDPGPHAGVRKGQIIVSVDPRYFRPTEVETLLGDASKAHRKLGWQPATSFEQLVKEMVQCDLEAARKYALIRDNGFAAFAHNE